VRWISRVEAQISSERPTVCIDPYASAVSAVAIYVEREVERWSNGERTDEQLAAYGCRAVVPGRRLNLNAECKQQQRSGGYERCRQEVTNPILDI
jgi:hypothetical protein